MSVVSFENAGFFSCCSVKLFHIIKYINSNKNIPNHVDSSRQFEWYKVNDKVGVDITYDYFEHYNNLPDIIYNSHIDYHWEYQFTNYANLKYNYILPIVQKYFYTTSDINNIIKNIEQKYNLDYDNICVLFYRGNDKNRETKICGYDEYIDYAKMRLKENPNIKILIQSDETEFIEFALNTFPNNSFYFKDEVRHIKKCDSTVDVEMKSQNYVFSKYYLAITIIMSKCKYIICGSGNCSIWIMFYRGHCKNVYQNLNGTWLNHSI